MCTNIYFYTLYFQLNSDCGSYSANHCIKDIQGKCWQCRDIGNIAIVLMMNYDITKQRKTERSTKQINTRTINITLKKQENTIDLQWARQLKRQGAELRAGLPGFDPGCRRGGDFSSLLRVQTGSGVHSASYKMSTGVFPGDKGGRAQDQPPYLFLVPWL